MSYFMIRSAAGYLQSGSLVAVAAPAADAVRRESGRAAHLPAVCCDVGGRRWHRGNTDALDSDTLYYVLSILCLVAANLCAGLMTTACFTAMMTLSQSAAPRVQTSHYSLLSTMEVLGKLMFASVAGALIDLAGLESVFIVFVILAIATVPLLLRMPNLDLVKPHCDTK